MINSKTLQRQLLFLLLFLFISCSKALGQKYFESKQFGLKILKPANWIKADNKDVENSINHIKFDDEQLIKVLNSKKGILTLGAYFKYDINSVSGFIPTVKIIVRNNPAKTDAEFKQMQIEGTNRVKTVVQNFEYIQDFTDLKLSEYNSLFYSCRYSFSLSNGESMNVRTRYYMIPKGEYYISISFMDNETDENNSELFDQLLNSLELKH